MLARLVRNPLLIGVGAGAVLLLGSASAVLAQADPSPSASPCATDPSEPPPALSVALKRTGDKTDGAVSAGTTVPMAACVTAGQNALTKVSVKFGADAPATATPDANDNCDASTHVCTFDIAAGETVPVNLTVAINVASGTVNVRAVASTDTLNASTSFPLAVQDPSSNNNGGGGTGGDKNPGGGTTSGTGKQTTGSTHHSTRGSNGSTTTGGSNGLTGGNVPTQPGALKPPSTSGLTPSTAPSPGAVLPSIGAQPPATAGNPPVLTGNSQSMRSRAEGPAELTFNKLASTQAAWLAVLLVAFSLLLTQVRLGKAANRANRPVGVHRRLRRRVQRPRSH